VRTDTAPPADRRASVVQAASARYEAQAREIAAVLRMR